MCIIVGFILSLTGMTLAVDQGGSLRNAYGVLWMAGCLLCPISINRIARLSYEKEFPEHIVLTGRFPMEILNYIPNLSFRRVVSVFTVPNGIMFAKEVVFLGEDFMDKYEAPELHRQNEFI